MRSRTKSCTLCFVSPRLDKERTLRPLRGNQSDGSAKHVTAVGVHGQERHPSSLRRGEGVRLRFSLPKRLARQSKFVQNRLSPFSPPPVALAAVRETNDMEYSHLSPSDMLTGPLRPYNLRRSPSNGETVHSAREREVGHGNSGGRVDVCTNRCLPIRHSLKRLQSFTADFRFRQLYRSMP